MAYARDYALHDGAPQQRTLSERTVVARKRHKCDSCPRPIEAGTRYYRIALMNDGDFEFWRMHSKYGCEP